MKLYLIVKRIAAVGGQDIEADGRTYSVPPNCYFAMGAIGIIPGTRGFGKIRSLKRKS